MTSFDRAFAAVLGAEGGYTDNPADRGNWTSGTIGKGECRGTKYGISAAAYPSEDIRALTVDQAKAIYRRDYWDRISGDALPYPVALVAFDAAVNSGVGRAVRWLQAAVGATQDGAIGQRTLAAVQATVARPDGVVGMCVEMLAQRNVFMAASPGWAIFDDGWSRRLFRLAFTAAG